MSRNQAEQMLISSILRNGDLQTALKQGINANMFHVYQNEYRWIEDYYLKRSKAPQKPAFHLAWPDFTIKTVDETEHFVDEVKREHKLKSILSAVSEVVDLTDNDDPDAALELMHSAAMKISQDMGLIRDGDVFRDHEDIVKEFAIRKARFDATGTSGIPTGFETFDERTGGFAPGELHIVAARTGRGKSWTMQKYATHAALAGYSVLYYALEQPRANVMARAVSLISPRVGGHLYTAQNLIRGKDYDAREFQQFMIDLEHNVKGKLFVADGTMGRISTAAIAAGVERHKPDIVFVDHITLMSKRTSDHVGLGEVADELTSMTNQYSLPIIAGAQLNRLGAQKGSGAEAIAEADKIGQDASGLTVIEGESTRVMSFHQRKYRNGSDGWGWWAKFNPDAGEFREISYELAHDLIDEDEYEEKQGKEE